MSAEHKLCAVQRWPRRNDADSIRARQEALRDRVGEEVFAHDLRPWEKAQEVLTGAGFQIPATDMAK